MQAGSTCWQKLSVTGERRKRNKPAVLPKSRCGHCTIADGARMVVLGGHTDELYADAWALDLKSNKWSELKQSALSPLPRAFCTAVAVPSNIIDTLNGYLYGGSDGEAVLRDLWHFSVDATTVHWTQLPEHTVQAAARAHHAMCSMGSTHSFILHGGDSDVYLDDTWLYDSAADTWSQLQLTAGSPKPGARSQHAITYCSSSSTLVLFGGMTSTSLAAAAAAAGTSGSTAGADTANDNIIQIDAANTDTDTDIDDVSSAPLNDLWVCSKAHSDVDIWTWSLLLIDGIGPSPRCSFSMVAASNATVTATAVSSSQQQQQQHDIVFLFGGHGLVELPASQSAQVSTTAVSILILLCSNTLSWFMILQYYARRQILIMFCSPNYSHLFLIADW
jgi:Galactose oxidase, central domain